MSTKTEIELHSALLSTGLVQPVEAESKGGSVSILCRQVPGQEREWLEALARMLAVAEENKIKVHLCRRYILRDGQMVFGWHIQVEASSAKALKTAVEPIAAVLKSARPRLTPQEPIAVPPPLSSRAVRARIPAPGTTAHGRSPNSPAQVQEAPDNFHPTLRTVRDDVDDDGKRHIEQEFPIPHVYKELNAPNDKQRGAKKTAG